MTGSTRRTAKKAASKKGAAIRRQESSAGSAGVEQLLSIADIDRAHTNTRERATLTLDTDLVVELARLEELLRRAVAADAKAKAEDRVDVELQAPPLAERIVELTAKAEASKVEFVFESIGRKRYTDLLHEHRPSEEKRAEAAAAGVRIEFDPDTFPPALMAESCVQPHDSTKRWWVQKYDEWAPGQIEVVWGACMSAHAGVNEAPKAHLAWQVIRGSEQS